MAEPEEHSVTFDRDDRTAIARCTCGWTHDEGGTLAGRRVAEAAHTHLIDTRTSTSSSGGMTGP